MKLLKNVIYFILIAITFYFNSYLWTRKLPTVIYEDGIIPVDIINENTFLGISLILLIFLFIYALVGRYFTTLFLANGMMYLFFYANKTKYLERGEVVNFNELKVIVNLRELNNLVDIKVISISMFVSIVLIAILFFYETKLYKKLQISMNGIVRILLLIVTVSFSYLIYKDSESFTYNYFEIEKPKSYIFNPTKEIKRIGFIPNFIVNISRSYMDTPDGYSLNEVKLIEDKYTKETRAYNSTKENNVKHEKTYVYLSESFWQDTSLLESPLPALFINGLEKNYGGKMKTLFVGGGTANVEFEVLTSMSLELHENPIVITPYVDYFEKAKIHSSFLTLVDDNITIHPYNYKLYNRKGVYKKMNIETLISAEDIENPEKINKRISDETLHEEILKYTDDYTLFNVLSMQNHSKYANDTLKDEVQYIPQYKKNIFYTKEGQEDYVNYIEKANAFFRQIAVTDISVKTFIDAMESQDENINLIFYGDHGPNFLRNKEKQLGDAVHETSYFIYRNHDRNTQAKSNKLNPMFLVPKFLSDGNYKVTPFYYMLVQLYQNEITGVTKDGVYINGLYLEDEFVELDILEIVRDYRIVSYNRFFDKKGLSKDFFEMQYE